MNLSGMLYAEQFRYCLDTLGVDHILWGENYPYRRKENIRSFLESFDLPDEEREKIAMLFLKRNHEIIEIDRQEAGYCIVTL